MIQKKEKSEQNKCYWVYGGGYNVKESDQGKSNWENDIRTKTWMSWGS